MQRSPLILVIRAVHLGAMLEEHLHNVAMPLACGLMQCRVAARAATANSSVSFQQRFDDGRMAVGGGLVERRVAFGGRLVRVRSVLQQQPDPFSPPRVRCVVQGCVALVAA